MADTVYIETSIISYLTSRVSRDLIGVARQQLTQAWWQVRLNYDLYISEVVSRECAAGDPNAAKKRLDAIQGLPLLRVTMESFRPKPPRMRYTSLLQRFTPWISY